MNGRPFVNRVGESFISTTGSEFEIIECFGTRECTIVFKESGFVMKNQQYDNLRKGLVRDPFVKHAYGVGYLGLGDFVSVVGKNKSSEYYKSWRGMFYRCYSDSFQKIKPTYIGCYVDERWHDFQVFAKWHVENYNPETMQGWHLDKDILLKGNKVYGPDTCCFVPNDINSLFRRKSKCTKNYYLKKRINRILFVAESYKHLVDKRVYEALINLSKEY